MTFRVVSIALSVSLVSTAIPLGRNLTGTIDAVCDEA
jgi:hypothetical protein